MRPGRLSGSSSTPLSSCTYAHSSAVALRRSSRLVRPPDLATRVATTPPPCFTRALRSRRLTSAVTARLCLVRARCWARVSVVSSVRGILATVTPNVQVVRSHSEYIFRWKIPAQHAVLVSSIVDFCTISLLLNEQPSLMRDDLVACHI